MSVRFAEKKRILVIGFAGLSLLAAASSIIYFSIVTKDARFSSGYSTPIPRLPGHQPPKANLASAADPLFSEDGKEDRADYVSRQSLATASTSATTSDSKGGDIQFVAASLTPVDMSRPGPTKAAGYFRQDVNRSAKTDRLIETLKSQPAIAKTLANDATNDVSGISAALFMVSPPPVTSSASEQKPKVAQAEASGWPSSKASWADLIKLARVGSGDGENKKPSIFGGLTEDEFRAREFSCMATAIYFEARGESVKGQTAVAQVIMTRVRSDYYPNTICGVVFQGQWNRNACQFSFACDGRADTPGNKRQWETALNVAKKVISGQVYLKEIGEATHYHATYVSPRWRKLMKRVRRIGVHIFYKADFVQPLVASADFKQL